MESSENIEISIIVPAYNAKSYLNECMDSILGQSVSDIEVICIDDGSNDGTAELLEGYAQRDSRVFCVRQENKGQGAARNVGLRRARGKYVQFVDADDRLAQDALASLLKHVDDIGEGVDMLLFDGSSFYESKELEELYPSYKENYTRDQSHDLVTGPQLFTTLKNEGAYRVSPCLALFSNSFLKSRGITFPEGIIYEDNVFFAKAICLAEKAAHVNEAYYQRRVREGSTMTSEIAARNVLSYFEVYLEMVKFAMENPGDYASANVLAGELRIIQRQLVRFYKELDNPQKAVVRSLPPVKLALLDNLVSCVDESKKREKAEKKIKAMKSSTIWKVGRYATYPARALKRALKSN